MNSGVLAPVEEGGLTAVARARLDQRRVEVLQVALLEQLGPEAVEHRDDQPLDVRAVLVLVGHEHQPAVAQLGTRGAALGVPRAGLQGQEEKEGDGGGGDGGGGR
jgi:hypothetical protein